jgi:DNA-binding transcriptional LysR family regulator
LHDPVYLVLPSDHPAVRRHRRAVPLAKLAGDAWTTGQSETAWRAMTERTCRELGRFDPDIRHRTNDSVTSLALVAQGQAVTLLPRLVRPEAQAGVAVRAIAEGSVHRTVFAATRFGCQAALRESLLDAVRAAAASLGRPAPGQAAA